MKEPIKQYRKSDVHILFEDMNKMKNYIDKTFLKFCMVGVLNTMFGTVVMFIGYNILHLNYWISSSANYILGSVLSFFLNKYFTFQNKSKKKKVVIKFVVNIVVCYFFAYGIAKPLVSIVLRGYSETVQENGAMLVGMVLFVILNYFGQRFYAFKKDNG